MESLHSKGRIAACCSEPLSLFISLIDNNVHIHDMAHPDFCVSFDLLKQPIIFNQDIFTDGDWWCSINDRDEKIQLEKCVVIGNIERNKDYKFIIQISEEGTVRIDESSTFEFWMEFDLPFNLNQNYIGQNNVWKNLRLCKGCNSSSSTNPLVESDGTKGEK
jgi:hypothetical protein